MTAPNPLRIRCHSSQVAQAKAYYPNAEVLADDTVEGDCWIDVDREDQ